MEAKQYRECLHISATPIRTLEYYNFLLDRYNAIIDPHIKELPQKPHPTLALSSPETKRLIKNIFGNVKRGMGYGG